MARQILAWQCRYCGDVKKTRKIAERHEKTCLKNPEAKNCVLCIHSMNDPYTNTLVCSVRKLNCSRAVSADCDQFQTLETSVGTRELK